VAETSSVPIREVETTTDVAPAVAGGLGLAQPAGAVTSPYGWRTDPINGQARFHAGADIRSAYGQEVRAAAAGRVAFAGEKGAYGETLVIDHGNGVETRYAHLSGYAVREGDLVDAGQLVARSGNSGRSTGPHLHFEVLKGGRAVDPSQMAQSVAVKDFPVMAESDHE
jgi:murein DD-endopeptidase MepM/ murein hydrolase activator NlpD